LRGRAHALAAILMAAAGCGSPQGVSPTYATAEVQIAPLIDTVLATGRIHTVTSIDVSSQLSGRVDAVYVDFNDAVSAGQPLARLDPQRFASRVEELNAALAVARAELTSAEAAMTGAAARFEEDARDLQRKVELGSQGSVSSSEVSRARAVKAQSESGLASFAAVREIKAANIVVAAAALRQAEIDLERTVIRAPISGSVIERSIEPGQTVAVSLSAPELFTIAGDLGRIEVHARVDEADIGKVRVAQSVIFSVEAYPSRTFDGTVVQLRKAPDRNQNVVSYTVVIEAENPEQLMLPGMTALVEIVTSRRDPVLQVPNEALRFTMAGEPPGTAGASRAPGVWVLADNGAYERRPVRLGYANHELSEVQAATLAPGERVIIGYRR
jgi:HlyD family secretion protein